MAKVSEERKEFLHDVFTAALEGGIGYWSQASEYHWSNATKDDDDWLAMKDNDGFFAVIHELDDNEDSGYSKKGMRVTRHTIARGIRKLHDKNFKVRDDIRKNVIVGSMMNDAGDIDSECADVIVQAALFGEIIYG